MYVCICDSFDLVWPDLSVLHERTVEVQILDPIHAKGVFFVVEQTTRVICTCAGTQVRDTCMSGSTRFLFFFIPLGSDMRVWGESGLYSVLVRCSAQPVYTQ